MFIQLTSQDCQYLLNLIYEMDSDTLYTAKQRGYTVPKLTRIQQDPRSARLAFQDIDYLLELIEDDDLEELMQQREMTKVTLEEIRQLQNAKVEELRDIESQRGARRMRRLKVEPEHTLGAQLTAVVKA